MIPLSCWFAQCGEAIGGGALDGCCVRLPDNIAAFRVPSGDVYVRQPNATWKRVMSDQRANYASSGIIDLDPAVGGWTHAHTALAVVPPEFRVP